MKVTHCSIPNVSHVELKWFKDSDGLNCIPEVYVALETFVIPRDLYSTVMKGVVRYLITHGVTPEDEILFGCPNITLTSVKYPEFKLILFRYLTHQARRHLISLYPSMGTVMGNHYDIMSKHIPQFVEGFEDHVYVKVNRLHSVMKVLNKGTFQDKPYELFLQEGVVIHTHSRYLESSLTIDIDLSVHAYCFFRDRPLPSPELVKYVTDRFDVAKVNLHIEG